MRIRLYLPLPGPFALTGGGGRRGPGCLPWLAAAVAVGLADMYPWLLVIPAAVVVLAVLTAWRRR